MMTRRRFYTDVAVSPHEEGFTVTLDGRSVKTPAGGVLTVANAALAAHLAEEWRAQGESIEMQTMALTRYAGTAIDRTSGAREAVIDTLMGYVDGDVLCYRAEAPDDLVALQRTHWDPLVAWARDRFSVPIAVRGGIMPFPQDAAFHRAMRGYVEALDDLALTVFGDLAAMAGSLILAVAAGEGDLDAERTFTLSHLEETYQIEHWGEDDEARTRRENVRTEIVRAVRILDIIAGREG